MKRLQHVVARKHVIIISVLSAALLALVVGECSQLEVDRAPWMIHTRTWAFVEALLCKIAEVTVRHFCICRCYQLERGFAA